MIKKVNKFFFSFQMKNSKCRNILIELSYIQKAISICI